MANINWTVPFITQLGDPNKCWLAATAMLDYWRCGEWPEKSDYGVLREYAEILDARGEYHPATLQSWDVPRVAKAMNWKCKQPPVFSTFGAKKQQQARAQALAAALRNGPVGFFGYYTNEGNPEAATGKHVTVLTGISGSVSDVANLKVRLQDPWNGGHSPWEGSYEEFESSVCRLQTYWWYLG